MTTILTSVTFLLLQISSVYSMPNHLSEKSILSPIYPIFPLFFKYSNKQIKDNILLFIIHIPKVSSRSSASISTLHTLLIPYLNLIPLLHPIFPLNQIQFPRTLRIHLFLHLFHLAGASFHHLRRRSLPVQDSLQRLQLVSQTLQLRGPLIHRFLHFAHHHIDSLHLRFELCVQFRCRLFSTC